MTLHDAITQVLTENPNGLSFNSIAGMLNERKLYQKKDGSSINENQIRIRIYNYKHLFNIENEIVLLNSFQSEENLFHVIILDILNSTSKYSIGERYFALPFLIFFKRVLETEDKEYRLQINLDQRDQYELLCQEPAFQHPHLFNTTLIELVNDVCTSNIELEAIRTVFASIIKNASKNLFFDIFHALNKYSFDSKQFSKQNFCTFFDELISRLSISSINHERNITPHGLNNLITGLYKNHGNTIMDPFAGSAGTLVSAFKKLPSFTIGYEVIPENWLLGKLNLILNGISSLYFYNTDCLKDSGIFQQKVDLIISHLPFNALMSKEAVSQIPWAFSRDAISNYLQYIIDSLNEKGRAVLIVPSGFLFGNSRGTILVKELLVSNSWLDAVIALPKGVFLPYSGVSSAILCFDLNKKDKSKYLFIDASEVKVEKSNYNQRSINDDYLDEIILRFNSREETFDSPFAIQSALINKEDIEDQGFDLNPKRYLSKRSSDAQMELFMEGQNYIAELHELISKKSLKIKHKEVLDNYKILAGSDLKNSIVDYKLYPNEIKQKEKFTGKAEVIDSNCLVVFTHFKSLKPTYVMNEQEDIYISNNIKAFNVNEEAVSIDYLISQFYEPYFLNQLESIRKGTSQQYFSTSDFLKLKIKVPSKSDQVIAYNKAKEIFLSTKAKEAELLSKELVQQKEVAVADQINIISSIQHELGNKLPALKNTITDIKRFVYYYATKNPSFSPEIKIREILPGENSNDIDSLLDVLNRSEKILNYTIGMVDDAGGIINSDPSKFNPQRTNLVEFINSEIESLKRMHGNLSNVKFEFPLERNIFLPIDKKQISVALSNLIQNAVLHGFVEPDRDYHMVFQIIPDDNYIILVVKNDGIPFPQGFTIEKYKQAYQFAGKNGHSGLGGFIINRIIENHKGIMSLRNDIDSTDNFQVQFEFKFQQVF